MSQSHQDDTYDALATFAETTYIFLVLVGKDRRLNRDEVYLLGRAAKVAAKLHGRNAPFANQSHISERRLDA